MAAFPCNPPIAPYHGNCAHVSNYTFPSQNNYSISPCPRCTEVFTEAKSLRARISELDAQLIKAQKDKADADIMIRFLLRISCEKDVASTVNDTSQNDSDLSRKVFQANTEKDCLKVMLDHAMKEIVNLRVRILGIQNSKPDACQDLLGDYLGYSETNGAADSGQNLPLAMDNVDEQEHHESTLDAEHHSDSSYIFRFVSEPNGMNGSSDEDKITLMREKAAKPKTSVPQSNVNLISTKSTSSRLLDVSNKPRNSSSIEPASSNEPATAPASTQSTFTKIDHPKAEKGPDQKKCSDELELGKVFGVIERPIKFPASRRNGAHPFQRQAGPKLKRYSEFCNHALRYNPVRGSGNVFRTLVISNIPQEATMTALLDQVRGGVVVDTKLLNTFSITGANTALVTFLDERTAIALETYTKDCPIVIGNQTTHTTLLKTPTWPSSRLVEKAGFDGIGTRCLEVSKYPRKISPAELRRQLQVSPAMEWDRIEHMVMRDDGILLIRFQSMADAVMAKDIFTSGRNFRGCVAEFAPDPCAQPLRAKAESNTEKDHENMGSKLVAMKELMLADDTCPEEFPSSDEGRLSKVEWDGPPVISHGRGFRNGI